MDTLTRSSSLADRVKRGLQGTHQVGPVVLAVLVGLGGGGAAIFFYYLIPMAASVFRHAVADPMNQGLAWWLGLMGIAVEPSRLPIGMLLVPAAGLAIVAVIVERFAREARGHGVPEVQLAMRKHGGRIRPRVAVVKSIASALTIGAGGAVGREGPIVQIGCSVGSTIGQWFGLRDSGVKLLVACGAAAGIAATFNAPVAGVLFALEVILADFSARSFGLVVIASVAATTLSRSVLGPDPTYKLTDTFHLVSAGELPLYVLMGLGMGLLALLYVKSVYWLEDVFDHWRSHVAVKGAAGGLALGLLGWLQPDVLGMGHDPVMHALGGHLSVGLLLALAGLKILACSITLGAGGSGGVFAPALFIGATAGGAFGVLAHGLFPGMTAPSGAYALVGMGALFGAAAHAPITAILILFEMTNDYRIMLPLLLAVVVAYLVASAIKRDSIYTIKLRREGGLAEPRPGMSVLDGIVVADAMVTDPPTAGPDTPVAELADRMHRAHLRSLPVVDADGRLVGIVTETDIEDALFGEHPDDALVKGIMTKTLLTCHPDETLNAVLTRFRERNVRHMPVVERDDPERLLGVLRREELLWAYGEVTQEHARMQAATDVHGGDRGDVVLLDATVETDDTAVCYRRIGDLGLPARCLIVRLRRGGHDLVPRGATVVEPGDQLTLFTTGPNAQELRRWAERSGLQAEQQQAPGNGSGSPA